MEHDQKLLNVRKLAVDSNEVSSTDAIIEPVRPERHFNDRDLKASTEEVKIVLTERPLVPANS